MQVKVKQICIMIILIFLCMPLAETITKAASTEEDPKFEAAKTKQKNFKLYYSNLLKKGREKFIQSRTTIENTARSFFRTKEHKLTGNGAKVGTVKNQIEDEFQRYLKNMSTIYKTHLAIWRTINGQPIRVSEKNEEK